MKSLITKKYTSLFWAGTVGMLVEYVVLFSDSVIAGRMLGENGLAALSLISPFISFTAFATLMLSYGVSVCVSQEVGRMDRTRANELLCNGITWCVAIGFLLSLALLVYKESLLDFMNVPPRISAYVSTYFDIILWVPLLFPAANLLYETIVNEGSEDLAFAASAVQVASNIGFSVFLCRRIGIVGIGIGTLVSVAIQMLICCLHFLKKENEIRFIFRFSCKDFFNTIKYGFSDASVHLYLAIFSFTINLYITKHYGAEMLVAFFVVMNMQLLTASGLDGVGTAMQPLIGIYFGENNLAGIKNVLKIALKFALVSACVICASMLFFAYPIVWAMGVKNGAAVAQALEGIRFFAPSCFFTSLIHLYTAYFLSTEKVGAAVYFNTLSYFVFQLGLSLLLISWLGMLGIWISMLLAPTCAVLVGALGLKSHPSKNSFPLFMDQEEGAKWRYFEATSQPAHFMEMAKKIECFLRENYLPERDVLRTVLLVEEMCIAIAAQNQGSIVCLDCSVRIGEHIDLIFRDEGQLVNLTETDRSVSSLQSFLTSSIIQSYSKRQYLRATGLNRSSFEVPLAESDECEKGEGQGIEATAQCFTSAEVDAWA